MSIEKLLSINSQTYFLEWISDYYIKLDANKQYSSIFLNNRIKFSEHV